jgi:hypothetical protein
LDGRRRLHKGVAGAGRLNALTQGEIVALQTDLGARSAMKGSNPDLR